MTTIYNWDEVATLSGSVDTTSDLLFMFDASTGRTVKVAMGLVQTNPTQTTASNLGTISGAPGVSLIGTSTAVFLSAPTVTGGWKWILNNSSSTILYTITASGSSFNTGLTIVTSGGGGAYGFVAASTLKWIVASDFQALTSSVGVVVLS